MCFEKKHLPERFRFRVVEIRRNPIHMQSNNGLTGTN